MGGNHRDPAESMGGTGWHAIQAPNQPKMLIRSSLDHGRESRRASHRAARRRSPRRQACRHDGTNRVPVAKVRLAERREENHGTTQIARCTPFTYLLTRHRSCGLHRKIVTLAQSTSGSSTGSSAASAVVTPATSASWRAASSGNWSAASSTHRDVAGA